MSDKPTMQSMKYRNAFQPVNNQNWWDNTGKTQAEAKKQVLKRSHKKK